MLGGAVLLAVPNCSEGRSLDAVREIVNAFQSDDTALLDFHFDTGHNRTVVTIAGEPQALAGALLAGARAASESIDMRAHAGAHPCVGALDVCPVVYLRPEDAEAAERAALGVADAIADRLEIPVFLYGELASSPEGRERAFFRRGGLPELTRRMRAGELKPDRGPDEPHPTAGATLVTARPPLAAFNLLLDTRDIRAARAIAGELRESGGGLPGVRAIALELEEGIQISTNVHDPVAVPLARVVAEVERIGLRHAAKPTMAEFVGLVPEAALEGFPSGLALADPDLDAHVIERRLAELG
jgi:glutamate formiminotransferase / 5-formyltetrahydrofolate cyclo-ligase